MDQDDSYDLKPADPKPGTARPKPGDPDWVPPVPIIEKADASAPPEEPVDPDVQNNKAMALLAYVVFLIPLAAAAKSPFARFHANQGLMVFILWCIAWVVFIVLEVIWYFGSTAISMPWIVWALFGCIVHLVPMVLFLGALAFTIMGVINAANGEKKQLPLIGHWKAIK